MNLRSRTLLGCSVLAAVCFSGSCRAPAESGEAAPAVRTGPGTELDWTIGRWTGARRAGGDGRAEPLTLVVAEILGGAGQVRSLEIGMDDGGTYHGFASQLYAGERGVWVREYANPARARFTELEGVSESESRSVWRVTSPTRTRESRLVEERTSADSWVRTMNVSRDGGTTWSVLWVDELERVDGGYQR